MRAVITVVGKDTVGIVAKVAAICSENNANLIEVTQSVLQDMFAMIMLVDIGRINNEFSVMSQKLVDAGQKMGMQVHVMHEDIFNSMHRI